MKLLDVLGPDVARLVPQRLDELPCLLLYGDDAAPRLAEELVHHCAGHRVTVLADARTIKAGSACPQALRRNWQVREVLVEDKPDGSPPVCDDVSMQRLRAELPASDVLVAVGSGVINDLTKWLAADLGLPYAVFATAASMNGYAAANVAPTIQGLKSLARARAPRIIAADPSVLAQAPAKLTASGLGDVIAKPVSSADWAMNHQLFGEDFSAPIARIIDDVEPAYLQAPAALRAGEPQAMRALFEALVLSGCAMTLQGSSLPASGGEHLISHTLDMFSHVDGRAHDLHGRQVGVATIFAAALYQRVMALDTPELRDDRLYFEPSVWGPLADAVAGPWKTKQKAHRDACRKLQEPGAWDSLRQRLKPMLREPSAIQQCLRTAGAACAVADIGCSRERFLRAVMQAATMRGRFTSLDLGFVTGVLPAAAEELIDTWLMQP